MHLFVIYFKGTFTCRRTVSTGQDECQKLSAFSYVRSVATQGGPLVGPVPGVSGLYLATGHEGSGLTLGPVTGEIVKEHLLGRPHALPDAAQSWLPKLA